MNLSYWEKNTWLTNIDYAVVGSGIVGLSCALFLRKRFPHSKIVVFEKGMLPSGASTKNAGFACFGSVSEILEDLKSHSEEEVIQIVQKRIEGLELLRSIVGDVNMDFNKYGGYELFTQQDEELYEHCLASVPYINKLLKGVFSGENHVFSVKDDPFLFKNIQKMVIFNKYEGQIDTGKMMDSLLSQVKENGVFILNSAKIGRFWRKNGQISFILNNFEEIQVKNLLITTNGFAGEMMNEDLKPARAQVLITKPIDNLKIKGTFHLDKGYYYFRNIHNRILFGGGRNLDFETEETSVTGLTDLVQSKLEQLLRTTILPGISFEIDSRWSGIMGVGGKKKPIVKQLDENVYCGVRLGGMGVAIGCSIGKQLSELIDS